MAVGPAGSGRGGGTNQECTGMKQLSAFHITCGILLAAGVLSVLPLRSQNATVAVVGEQYRILSARNPANNQPKTDEFIERELNTLAAQGWKVRTATQTAIILAR